LDNRSDIYALGVVLYEMVTGHRPFTGRTLPELTQAIVSGPLHAPGTLNPEVAPELERIILTAMARNRDERYADAGLMAKELYALQLRVSRETGDHKGPLPTSVPAPTGTGDSSPFPPAQSHTRREGIVIRPPKRPQAVRPSYLDMEATRPLPGEANEQTGTPTPQLSEGSPRKLDRQKEYQREPAAPGTPLKEDGIPTGPLEPVSRIDESRGQEEQATKSLEIRRTLWRRLFHKGD